MNEFDILTERAYEALIGRRNDVYPCREDVPAELWGHPIKQKIENIFDTVTNL